MGGVAQVSVGGYWINHYKICGQSRTDYCNSLVGGFAGAMKARGHNLAVIRSEDAASPKHWGAWSDRQPGGVDTVEFVFLATHGATHGVEMPGSNWLYWVLFTFDSTDGCIWATIGLSHKGDGNWQPQTPSKPDPFMRLGEGRLRWAVLDFCRSLQIGTENERDLETKRQLAEANPARTWGPCFDGVHMLFGFTGLASDAGWTAQRGASFGQRAAKGETLGDSWLDEAYSYWVDDVPVVLACGRSEDDAVQRLKTESLAAVAPTLRAPGIGGYYHMWRS
jgi:hypothetical protein